MTSVLHTRPPSMRVWLELPWTFMLRLPCEPLRRRSLELLLALLNDMFAKGKTLEHLRNDLHGTML